MSTTTKCHHPTPPIALFPRSRRTRRKQPISTTTPRRRQKHISSKDEQLDSPIDRENHEPFDSNEIATVLPNDDSSETIEVERRDRVEEEDNEEEKWRFQAEILRAECNFLRIERDFSLKKMENTLKSALQSLISGRQKILEGKNVNAVLQEEIEGLEYKLQELRKCNVVRMNMEKEYSVPSSVSTSNRIECPDISGFLARQLHQEPTVHVEKKCSGQCKAIVRKIVEQVRAETDQWSQMQEMLVQVRVEMEELRLSRDSWEDRAHNSAYEIQSLKHIVEKWKEKALVYEIKANELQLELSLLKDKLRKLKGNQRQNRDIISKNNDHNDENSLKFLNAKKGLHIEETKRESRPVSLAKQLAKEKRMLIRRLKEKRISSNKGSTNDISRRFPLCDIGNSSLLARENGESSRRRESFRK